MIYIYIVKEYYSQFTYSFPHIVSFVCVCVKRVPEIYSRSKFSVYNTIFFIVVTILYIISLELNSSYTSVYFEMQTHLNLKKQN